MSAISAMSRIGMATDSIQADETAQMADGRFDRNPASHDRRCPVRRGQFTLPFHSGSDTDSSNKLHSSVIKVARPLCSECPQACPWTQKEKAHRDLPPFALPAMLPGASPDPRGSAPGC